MAYNTFTYKNVTPRLGIEIYPTAKMYDSIPSVQPKQWLIDYLADADNFYSASEGARRENFIAPVFREVVRNMNYEVTLYSDIEFIIDKELQLNGTADYLFGLAPMQLVANNPIIAVAEAKVGNIISGLGQCIAEMYAVELFNAQKNIHLSKIFGVITDGREWIFAELVNKIVRYQNAHISIENLPKILGILIWMMEHQIKDYKEQEAKLKQVLN